MVSLIFMAFHHFPMTAEHPGNGLASPADAACRMNCVICEVIRYVAAPV